MHKGVDKAEAVALPAPRVLCSCGQPLGRACSEGGLAGELRLCPRCDFSPPLIAA